MLPLNHDDNLVITMMVITKSMWWWPISFNTWLVFLQTVAKENKKIRNWSKRWNFSIDIFAVAASAQIGPQGNRRQTETTVRLFKIIIAILPPFNLVQLCLKVKFRAGDILKNWLHVWRALSEEMVCWFSPTKLDLG